MVIIYDCELTEPPSSIHCFRDVSLYSKIFLGCDNVVKCPKGMRTSYWRWLKGYGAYDFVDEIILQSEKQSGLAVGKRDFIRCDLIDEGNYGNLIAALENIIKK
jgi:hypothetical protein